MRLKRVHIFLILVAVLSLLVLPTFQALTAEPGSDGDPIVTKSYVDQQVEILKSEIKELTAEVDELVNKVNELNAAVADFESGAGNGAGKFEVVELNKGQHLIAGASAEIILRSGSATAVAGELGGLSDVTSDVSLELMTGDNVPLNHLLIVSRDDGRGIKITSNIAFLLCKGEYEIK